MTMFNFGLIGDSAAARRMKMNFRNYAWIGSIGEDAPPATCRRRTMRQDARGAQDGMS